jgi:hypothetical protein
MWAKQWDSRLPWAQPLLASQLGFSPYSARMRSICRLVALQLWSGVKDKPIPKETEKGQEITDNSQALYINDRVGRRSSVLL